MNGGSRRWPLPTIRHGGAGACGEQFSCSVVALGDMGVLAFPSSEDILNQREIMVMHPLFLSIDPYLIWFYRITGYSFADFLIGTFLLASMALIVGEFTISLTFLAVRRHVQKTTDEVVHYQNLSVEALAARDKQAYLASNKLANDAFGKSFFMQIALSASMLWPVFFALGWMQQRFGEVEFRILFTDYYVGPICVFIPLYATVYLIFKKIKYKLPYFKRIQSILEAYNNQTKRMKSIEDVIPQREAIGRGSAPKGNAK
jgi:hypothetical protein